MGWEVAANPISKRELHIQAAPIPFFGPISQNSGAFVHLFPQHNLSFCREDQMVGEKGGLEGGGRMEGSESRLGSSPDSLIREAVTASHAKACLSPSAPAVASQSLCHGM